MSGFFVVTDRVIDRRFMLERFLGNKTERFAGSTLVRATLGGAIALSVLFALSAGAIAQAVAIAIVDFDYQDSSDEPVDQTAVHQKRLAAFMQALRDELSRSGKYQLVSFSCGPNPCSFTQAQPAEMLEKARSAGARLLLFGGIHKMSTLIQWAKVQAVDLQTDKPVFDRLLTFRGDTDDAWRRAEAFVVEQMKALDIAN